jgi:hypothetical protein
MQPNGLKKLTQRTACATRGHPLFLGLPVLAAAIGVADHDISPHLS